MSGSPWFEDLNVGDEFNNVPDVTITEGLRVMDDSTSSSAASSRKRRRSHVYIRMYTCVYMHTHVYMSTNTLVMLSLIHI